MAQSSWIDYLLADRQGGSGDPWLERLLPTRTKRGGGFLNDLLATVLTPGQSAAAREAKAKMPSSKIPGTKTPTPVAKTPAAPPPRSATPTPTPQVPVNTQNLSPAITRWLPQVNQYSSWSGVPLDVALAIMDIESQGNPDAESPAGAQGLFQVMPFHFPAGMSKEQMRDPDTNIETAMKLLSRLFGIYNNWESAAAAYFGAVDEDGKPTTGADVGGQTGVGYVQAFKAALGKYQPIAKENFPQWEQEKRRRR